MILQTLKTTLNGLRFVKVIKLNGICTCKGHQNKRNGIFTCHQTEKKLYLYAVVQNEDGNDKGDKQWRADGNDDEGDDSHCSSGQEITDDNWQVVVNCFDVSREPVKEVTVKQWGVKGGLESRCV